MIILFLVNLLFIWGLNFAAYGVLAPLTGRLTLFLAVKNITWLEKPLYMCRPCMSSIWGLPFFIYTPLDWYLYPIWITCLAGASSMIKQ